LPQQHRELTQTQRRFLAGLTFVIFLLFSLFIFIYVGRPMVRFVGEPERFRAWVDRSGIISHLLFVGMVVLQVLVALIPGEPLEIGAGYAFGFWEGTLLCYIGILLGSSMVFLLVRRFGRPLVEVFFSQEKLKSLRFLQNSRQRIILLFLVMLVPGTPKDLISYFAGLLQLSLPRWLLIVAIARIPSLVTSTMGGHAMGEENYLFAIIVFAAALIMALAGIYVYRKLGREEKAADKPQNP